VGAGERLAGRRSAACLEPLCVMFDLDGTLCDTVGVDDECYREAAADALAIPSERIDWTEATHHSDPGIARWLWMRFRSRSPTPAEVARLKLNFLRRLQAMHAVHRHRFRAVPGAERLLVALRASGVRVGIGTGGWRATAELKLAAAGLPSEVLYATADDFEARVDIFALAHRRTVGDSNTEVDTVLVGDGVWDVATARAFGWRFLGVGTDDAASRMVRAGAAAVVPDFSRSDVHAELRRACVPAGRHGG
jgi:phosphoglycolate phosphatase-like HAD superfamily hydrolase